MALEHDLDTPLSRAIKAVGSQSAFGRLIGRRQSTVREWLAGRKPLPAEYVLLVEAQTGVSKHLLRPDIYPAASTDDLTGNDSPVACNRSGEFHPEADNG